LNYEEPLSRHTSTDWHQEQAITTAPSAAKRVLLVVGLSEKEF
jgi:hypothetical protein